MQIPTWIYTLLIGGLLIGAGGFLAWMLGSLLEDMFAMRWRKQFEADLKLAIKHSHPSWEQVADMAASRNIKNEDIYWVLQKLLREILTGRETDLAAYRETVEGYIANLKEVEPFEGIPTEIRLHLERIKEQLSNNIHLMQPLTSHIRELLTVNEKEKRQQKYYTIGGFFVGFLGLIFAAFAYFYPHSDNEAMAAVVKSPLPAVSKPAPVKPIPAANLTKTVPETRPGAAPTP